MDAQREQVGEGGPRNQGGSQGDRDSKPEDRKLGTGGELDKGEVMRELMKKNITMPRSDATEEVYAECKFQHGHTKTGGNAPLV